MNFWLGTHQPHWLRILDIPLMVSCRTLARYRTLPRARGPWFRDSGGFTELDMFGCWTIDAATFASETRRHAAEIGQMAHAAPQDWMCEPRILRRTGLSVAAHQARTIANYIDLVQRAPEMPWLPVVQGWTLDEYLRCVEMYDRAGVDLSRAPLVGVGTICRRQATGEAATILRTLSALGLALHAFGLKTGGIPNVAPFLASSDSLAWSYAARRSAPLPGCTHKNCANCIRFALQWHAHILAHIAAHEARPYQLAFAA